MQWYTLEAVFTQTIPGPPPGAAAWLGTCAFIAVPAGGGAAAGAVARDCAGADAGGGAVGAGVDEEALLAPGDEPEAAPEAAPVLSTPPWWLHAPRPL